MTATPLPQFEELLLEREGRLLDHRLDPAPGGRHHLGAADLVDEDRERAGGPDPDEGEADGRDRRRCGFAGRLLCLRRAASLCGSPRSPRAPRPATNLSVAEAVDDLSNNPLAASLAPILESYLVRSMNEKH